MNSNKSESIDKYTTVAADSPGDLDAKVNALLQQGWQPFGAPYVYQRQGTTPDLIMQAMVQYRIVR